MKLSTASKIILSIIFCLLIGFISGFSTSSSISTWYVDLNKPFFNPPNWIFAPVWTTLYILMGVSFGWIWSSSDESSNKKKALSFFGIQLALNALWSLLFFGLKNPELALLNLIFLLFFIVVTIKEFSSINRKASWLLYPYLAWVSFATILNTAIVILN